MRLRSVFHRQRAAQADPIADFYKGKTVTIVSSGGVGGPIDLACRVVARFLPRHIPGNPTIVVRNMPGGGHVLMSNFMFTQAPKDGTTIGGVVNSIPTHQVIDGRGVRFDAGKFIWLGSTGFANLMTMAWHTSGFTTIKDVFERELLTGVTGVGSGTYIYTNAMNVILGTKFKMVMGYKDSASVDLAIERGEVQARGGMTLTGVKQERPHWIAEKKVDHAGADRRRARGRISRRAADARARAQRRGAADPAADLVAGRARAAVLPAAGGAGRQGRGAAQGVRRHHEGPRLHRRGQQGPARHEPAQRRAGHAAGQCDGPCAAGRRGEGARRAGLRQEGSN